MEVIMAKKQITREERKWKRVRILLFIAFAVSMLGYAIFLSSIFESFVGKAKSYEVTDTSIVVNLEDYKYAIVKGYITNEGKNPRWFYYVTESGTILKEEILQTEGASMDAEIALAQIITISNWKHPWLHELIFVAGTFLMLVIPIPFCRAIIRIEDEKLKKGEN